MYDGTTLETGSIKSGKHDERKKTKKKGRGKKQVKKRTKNKITEKEEKTSHLVEVVVDAKIIYLELSELRASPCNQLCPEKRKM